MTFDSACAIKLVEEIMRVVTDEDDMIAVSLFLDSGLDNKNDIMWMLAFRPIQLHFVTSDGTIPTPLVSDANLVSGIASHDRSLVPDSLE